MRIGKAWLLAAALSSGCGIPGRNNPLDGIESPIAHLQVVDAGAASCPSVLPDPASVILSASRGRCVALDATATIDPDGVPPSFRYDVLVPGEAAPRALPGSANVLFLDEATRLSLPPFEVLTFRVTVTDAAAPSLIDEADAEFVFQNAPPVAKAWARRDFPAGGFGWARGEDFDVTLRTDGSLDPDGDATQLCWIGDGETCLAPGDPPLVIPLAASEGRATWALRASDGLTESELATSVLTARQPDPWLQPDPSSFFATRLDGASFTIPGNQFVANAVSLGSESGVPAMITSEDQGVQDFYVIRALSNGAVKASVQVPRLGGTAVDSVSRRLWAARRPPGMTLERLEFYDISAAANSIVLAGGFDCPVASCVVGTSLQLLGVDSSGAPWVTISNDPDQEIWRLSESGAGSEIDPTNEQFVTGFAARPKSDEVWLSLITPFSDEGSSILRWSPAGEVSLPLPTGGYTSLWWADPERFWIFTENDGLLLVDADLFASGASLVDASSLRFPTLWGGGGPVFADSATGTLWWSAGYPNDPVEVRTDGTVRPLGSVFQDGAFDAVGVPWTMSLAGQITSGQTRNSDGIAGIALATVEGLQEGSLDPETGGIWALIKQPTRLRRLGPDGTILASYSTVLAGGLETEMPHVDPLRVSPDGAFAWGTGIDGLVLIDLHRLVDRDGQDEMTLVLSSAALAGLDPVLGTLEPLAPVAGEMPSAWLASNDGSLHLVKADGSDDEVVPAGNPIRAFSRSLVTNRACVATAIAGNVDVRWIATNGTAQPIAVLAGVGDIDDIISVTATFDAGREVCWVSAYDSPLSTRLVGWNDAGTKIHDQTINFLVFPWSTFSADPDVLWVAGLSSNFVGVVSEIRWNPVTGGAITSRRNHPYQYQYFIRP